MSVARRMLRGVMAFAIAAAVVAPASAATLVRASLDRLADENATIVVGEVLDVESYWNADHTFILTDVRIAALDVIKGDLRKSDHFTVTLMGGQVGDLTTLIIGGAQLIPGKPYVLFLNEESLPGTPRALTVRDHVQGAFDVRMTKSGLRAISQANGHPLVPDALGYFDAPGGMEGFALETMVQALRNRVAQREIENREVN